MDLLQKCAQEFDRLVPYQYHIIIGRKGKTLEFTISFDRADFHHLAGLHKLRDNVRLQTGKRIDIICSSHSVPARTHRSAAHSFQNQERIMRRDSRGIHCSKKKNEI